MRTFALEFVPRQRVMKRLRLLVAAGALTLIVGLVWAPERVWMNLLLLSFYALGLALAGTVFLALLYVSGGAWGTALRRIAEAMATLLPIGGAGLLAVLFFHPRLYAWANGGHGGEAEPVFRRLWLSLPFFRGRAILFLLLWTLFTWLLLRESRRQDADGDPAHLRRSTAISAGFLIVFGITFWLASFDWIMSVDRGWASTIFGMYSFAGMFVAGLSALALLAVYLRRRKPFDEIITTHHLHDLGKLIFGFSTFWMYLWFSQFMLIWYANLPDETVYFVRRLHGFWAPLFLLNIAMNWALPFLMLLPRLNKQNPGVLSRVCLVLLAGHWLDYYLMIAPPLQGPRPLFGLWEIGLAAGFVGLFGLGFFATLARAPVVPMKDPFLAESLHYHA